jgi:hypothetical protein
MTFPFDKNFYIKAYADVNPRFVDPYSHYKKFGIKENRLVCKKMFSEKYPLFNSSVYRSSNSDLEHFTDEQLFQHFHHRGRFENRKYINFVI